MANAGAKAVFLLGRAVLGGYFIYNGINHFKNRQMMTQYAGSKHVPAANVAVPATGAMLLFGGTSLLLGLKPRHGALAIIAFLAGVSPMMHDFWKQTDSNQRMAETVNFAKNMGLLGAALALAGVERWPLSIAAENERDVYREAKETIKEYVPRSERVRRSIRKMVA